MRGYIIFWTVIVIFSFASFTFMSLKMLIMGIPELREMFRQLRQTKLKRKGENQ